ncbi:glycoside hydrolase family 73 protein, partial [Candidatus Caldatribacterium sp.]|uniref:glycoside hydrolase family 73 protein n=1 Tax=Candidatus Caldatribacterium sp. TaxID=2282143 RepID=UPI003848D273|nr:glucosaminidase domain-containing protein [Candidatus Caldatribacterium sp.]
TKRLYISRMQKACEIARRKGATFNEAVVTAMGALESAWGTSRLAQEANNLFGIKAGTSWTGEVIELPTREFHKGQWIEVVDRFRKYPSWNVCIVDFADIIRTRPWFRDALKYLNDPDLFLFALLPTPGKWGWSTDPQYFHKVKAVAREIERLGGPKWH